MKYFKIIILIFFMINISCVTEKKVVKKKVKKIEPIEIKYEKFPQQNLLLRDTRFVGYINPKIFVSSELFKNNYKFIEKFLSKEVRKHLGVFTPFYFTLSDYQKRQELLIFFNQDLDFLLKDEFEVRQIEKNDITIFSKTNNQEFGYIKLKNNNSIYGDISLIQELFNIEKKIVPAISNERYKKLILNRAVKENSLINIIWMPYKDDFILINEFVKKQPLLKEILTNLSIISLDITLDKTKLGVIIKIKSSKKGVDDIYNLIKKELSFLITKLDKLDKINLETTTENNDFKSFLKNIKISTDKNSLIIRTSLNETLLLKFINKYMMIKEKE